MTIAYSSVTLSDTSITLREKAIIEVDLSGSPNGIVYGTVIIGDASINYPRVIELVYQAPQKYVAVLWGGRLGRRTSSVIKVIMSDDDGPVQDSTALNITVTESDEPYIVRPNEWVKDTLETYWDTTYVSLPKVLYPWERKAKGIKEMTGFLEIVEKKVETEIHGRGDYKTNRYPIELIARAKDKEKCIKMMAEARRVIEVYWNNIHADGMDYVEHSMDDAVNVSVEMAGQFEWRWNFKIVGVLRGRAGTPDEPRPIGGELMEVVASLPTVADARSGIFYLLLGGSGIEDKIYTKIKLTSGSYILKEIGGGGSSLFYEGDGLDGTLVTIMPASTVGSILDYDFVIEEVTGAGVGVAKGSIVPGGSAVLYTDGTDTLTLSVTAGGAIQIQRTAGADTFNVTGEMKWR